MMLPENMARLLAAMQESVTVSNNNNSVSSSSSGGRGQRDGSPQGGQQSQSQGMTFKPQLNNLNNNNQGEGNMSDNNGSPGYSQHKTHKTRGKLTKHWKLYNHGRVYHI